jgi:voltage-gated potassium channel Kch
MLVAALIFSAVIFYCDRSQFTSIPDAIWWAIVTMTTVGYGDLVPKSLLGKMINSLLSFLKINSCFIMFARSFFRFRIGILANPMNRIKLETRTGINTANTNTPVTAHRHPIIFPSGSP